MSWTTAPAKIIWSADWVNKRKHVTAGFRYEGVADWGSLAQNPWTVLVVFDEAVGADNQAHATVTLRAKWAPQELLEKGITFFMIEGATRVATVNILESPRQIQDPPTLFVVENKHL